MTEFKLPELGENIEQGDLVRLMIDADMEAAKKEAHMNGYQSSKPNLDSASLVRQQFPDRSVFKTP